MGLNDKAREFAGLLKSTPEYTELKQAKQVINRDRGLKTELQDFSKRQMALYSGRQSASNTEAEMKELGKRFESMSKVPEMDRYLKAVSNFNNLVSGVYKIINESISDSLK